jgi:hypothetical protein
VLCKPILVFIFDFGQAEQLRYDVIYMELWKCLSCEWKKKKKSIKGLIRPDLKICRDSLQGSKLNTFKGHVILFVKFIKLFKF